MVPVVFVVKVVSLIIPLVPAVLVDDFDPHVVIKVPIMLVVKVVPRVTIMALTS